VCIDSPRVTICMPCLRLGGSEMATLSFVRILAHNGYDVIVCCYYEHDITMVSRFEQAGARVRILGLCRGNLAVLFGRLMKFFRRERPDVVHVQYFAPGMVPILAARCAGVRRVFATVHAAGQRGYGRKAIAMLRCASLFTDHFFCVSHNAERFWFGSTSRLGENGGWSQSAHSTIHNCVEVRTIQAAAKLASREALCPGLPPGAKTIGIVGRLVRLKGHLTLMRAMRDVLAVVPNTFLLVIGEGPDEALFRREAEQLKMADRVIWKGRVEPEVLPRYYHIVDVLAVPSHWEGFGLAAAEAMAAGRPVVGTNVPGLREVVEDDVTGFLVPADEPSLLAQRLVTLLSDHSLRARMGRRGIERVERFFDVAQFNTKWLDAYATILARG